jgi:hypothetical protein
VSADRFRSVIDDQSILPIYGNSVMTKFWNISFCRHVTCKLDISHAYTQMLFGWLSEAIFLNFKHVRELKFRLLYLCLITFLVKVIAF